MGIIGGGPVVDAQRIAVFQQGFDGIGAACQFIEGYKEGGAGVVCFQTGGDVPGSGVHAVEGQAKLTGRGINHFLNGGLFAGILTAQSADRAGGQSGDFGTGKGRGKIQPFHILPLLLKGGGILHAGNQIKGAGGGLCRIVRLHRKQSKLPRRGAQGCCGFVGGAFLNQQQPGIAGQGGGIPDGLIQPVKDPVPGQLSEL